MSWAPGTARPIWWTSNGPPTTSAMTRRPNCRRSASGSSTSSCRFPGGPSPSATSVWPPNSIPTVRTASPPRGRAPTSPCWIGWPTTTASAASRPSPSGRRSWPSSPAWTPPGTAPTPNASRSLIPRPRWRRRRPRWMETGTGLCSSTNRRRSTTTSWPTPTPVPGRSGWWPGTCPVRRWRSSWTGRGPPRGASSWRTPARWPRWPSWPTVSGPFRSSPLSRGRRSEGTRGPWRSATRCSSSRRTSGVMPCASGTSDRGRWSSGPAASTANPPWRWPPPRVAW